MKGGIVPEPAMTGKAFAVGIVVLAVIGLVVTLITIARTVPGICA